MVLFLIITIIIYNIYNKYILAKSSFTVNYFHFIVIIVWIYYKAKPEQLLELDNKQIVRLWKHYKDLTKKHQLKYSNVLFTRYCINKTL